MRRVTVQKQADSEVLATQDLIIVEYTELAHKPFSE